PTNETVDQLRIIIKERWPSLFEKTLPAVFLLWKINDTGGDTSIESQIEEYSRGIRLNETGMPPHELISIYFPRQPPNDRLNIFVRAKYPYKNVTHCLLKLVHLILQLPPPLLLLEMRRSRWRTILKNIKRRLLSTSCVRRRTWSLTTMTWKYFASRRLMVVTFS